MRRHWCLPGEIFRDGETHLARRSSYSQAKSLNESYTESIAVERHLLGIVHYGSDRTRPKGYERGAGIAATGESLEGNWREKVLEAS